MHHDRNAPCLPPAQYQRVLGMHWLQMFDFGGHPTGHIALQWNPGSRTWTHSDAHDTYGSRNGIETNGFKWAASIPLPPEAPAEKTETPTSAEQSETTERLILEAILHCRDAFNFHVIADYLQEKSGVSHSPEYAEELLHGIVGDVTRHLPLTATHQQIEMMRTAIREGLIPAGREHAEKTGKSFDDLEADLLKAIKPTSRGGDAKPPAT